MLVYLLVCSFIASSLTTAATLLPIDSSYVKSDRVGNDFSYTIQENRGVVAASPSLLQPISVLQPYHGIQHPIQQLPEPVARIQQQHQQHVDNKLDSLQQPVIIPKIQSPQLSQGTQNSISIQHVATKVAPSVPVVLPVNYIHQPVAHYQYAYTYPYAYPIAYNIIKA